MNRSTLCLSISTAIDGFQKFKVAEGLSQRTVDSYEYYLNQWMNHIGDQDVAKIKPTTAQRRMLTIRLAARLRQLREGSGAASVEALIPGYLREAPLNRLTGRPLPLPENPLPGAGLSPHRPPDPGG